MSEFEVVSTLHDEYECIFIIKNRDLVEKIADRLTHRMVVEVVEEVVHLHHFIIRNDIYIDCAALGVKLTNRQLELLPQLPESIVTAEMIEIMETIQK